MAAADALRAFVTILPAELPDKSMFASIVLVARYRRPLWVWVGAFGAFALHVTVAVLAGSLLALLPDPVVGVAVIVIFLVGAVALARAGRRSAESASSHQAAVRVGARTAVVGSFTLIALAEWGDLTQLATASLAATSGSPWATGLGSLAAVATVAAGAVAFGRQLVARVAIQKVNYLGAAVFLALALWTAVELVS